MFRHTIPIGRVFGIPIDLDYSWFLIAALITWLLAVNYYPAEFKGGTSVEYWVMGAVTAILFFASIVVHELAHSWVALRYKVPVQRITLFIFGGVSQIVRRTSERQRRTPDCGCRAAHKFCAGSSLFPFGAVACEPPASPGGSQVSRAH